MAAPRARSRHARGWSTALLCLAPATWADTVGDAAVQIVRTHYGAVESSSGTVLDREDGMLDGAQLRRRAEVRWLSGELEAGYAKGRVAYQGRSQIGVPLSTPSDIAIYQAQFALGPPALDAGLLGRFSARLGMQGWRLERNIEPTALSGRLEETMQTRSWLARAEWRGQWLEHPRNGWVVAAQYGRAQRQSLQVNSFGAFDPATLRPAAATQWSLDAGWHCA